MVCRQALVAQNQHQCPGFCRMNKYGAMLGLVPLDVCIRPTFRNLRFSCLSVCFLSNVIRPVICVVQPLWPSQHKCTIANWNWVKKLKYLGL